MQKLFTRTFSGKNNFISYLLAIGFLFVAILLGIAIGTVRVPVSQIVGIIGNEFFSLPLNNEIDVMNVKIVANIRLPRVLLAGLVGASLAIAGAAFQGLLRNPLADPYTLGVSSGASVGAVFVHFFSSVITIRGNLHFASNKYCRSFYHYFSRALFCKNNRAFYESRDHHFNRDHF